MEPFYGDSGPIGFLKVWNATKGYLDVSVEGHLLQGETTAWVSETDAILSLIDQGLLVLLDDQNVSVSSDVSETAKKKPPLVVEDQSSINTDAPPVVDKNIKIKSGT